MIKLADITLLTLTKLRSRRMRTIFTIVLASLLFGILVATSIILSGAFKSVEDFREDSLTGRYIVTVNSKFDPQALYEFRRDAAVIAEAKSRYESLVAEKAKEAERLGVNYAQAMDQPPYSIDPNTDEEIMNIRDANGIVYELLEERFSGEPLVDEGKLAELASRYGAEDVFASRTHGINRGSLSYLPVEGEYFFDAMDEVEAKEFQETQKMFFLAITQAPKQISEQFLLENNASWSPRDKTIPIILPQNEVEVLLEKGDQRKVGSASDRLEYLTQLRREASDLTFQACYRNDDSSELIQKTVTQNKALEAGEGDEEYEAPSIIYELPDPKECENPYIVSDTRSDDQKKQDEAQAEFDEKFGLSSNPASQLVTFKVVGISPPAKNLNPNNPSQAESFNDIITDLLETNGLGQAIPQHLYEQMPYEDRLRYGDIMEFKPTYFFGNEDDKVHYVEFANASAATKFIDEQACEVRPDGKCHPEDREYEARLAFTNSVAIDDIQSKASEWFDYAMLAVAVFASVIMGITVGRTIADSRHETAIFRAIGFKRIDITMVYVLYSVLLAALIALLAALLGLLVAYVADVMLAPELTAQAQYGFGGVDMTKEFSLIGFNQEQLTVVLIACLGSGLLGMVIPLLASLKRNPMRDLREN